jgi:hypothetical protein
MTRQKLKVQCFALSLDGYGAGAEQSLENPLGARGMELMQWFLPTDVFMRMRGQGPSTLRC